MKKTDHATRIKPHMKAIVEQIHNTLKAQGIDDVQVHSIHFRRVAAVATSTSQALASNCVTLPDGTIICQ
jgi:uncharacterized protein YktB (UPF0637 family)